MEVCGVCRRSRHELSCPDCVAKQLQKRKVMVAGLQADVAVLRKKAYTQLRSRDEILQEEAALAKRMKEVEALTAQVLRTREQLCSERIAVVEQTSRLENISEDLEDVQDGLKSQSNRPETIHAPILQSLDLQIEAAQTHAATIRGDKLRELFALFALTPDDTSKYTRTIMSLPLPVSGIYDQVPPEVVSAALGKIIHLLRLVSPHLGLSFPHPMEFEGSFSTIGSTNEGAGCHTLYPDGTLGFHRGLQMLRENIHFFCQTQGVALEKLHPTDILGNLLQAYESPGFGTYFHQHTKTSSNVHENDAMDNSTEILPNYS